MTSPKQLYLKDLSSQYSQFSTELHQGRRDSTLGHTAFKTFTAVQLEINSTASKECAERLDSSRFARNSEEL